jgi:hypothetical protein
MAHPQSRAQIGAWLQAWGLASLRPQFAIVDHQLGEAIALARSAVASLTTDVANADAVTRKQTQDKLFVLEKNVNFIGDLKLSLGQEEFILANDPKATEEEKTAKLREMIKLTRTLTHSLDMMRLAPSGYFQTLLKDMRSWLEQNRMLGLGIGAAGGAAIGGISGLAYSSYIGWAAAAEATAAGLTAAEAAVAGAAAIEAAGVVVCIATGAACLEYIFISISISIHIHIHIHIHM